MNKEEQEAIENLKKDFILMNNGEYAKTDKYILYNYISKLQKENEEIRQWKYVIDTIEDLDKLKDLDIIKIKGKVFINEDKIRNKIKELEEIIKVVTTYEQVLTSMYTVGILKELLEE